MPRQRFLTLSVYNFFTRIILWNFAAVKFECYEGLFENDMYHRAFAVFSHLV